MSVYMAVPKGEDSLSHHGILGQKWGIRRYQNKDGTLTPEGKKRLGYDKYSVGRDQDITLKKGTKVSRGVVNYYNVSDAREEFGANSKQYKEALKRQKDYEKTLNTKYGSVDGILNSGRANGKEFYTSWFSDNGSDPDHLYMDNYKTTKDIRVAAGSKVVDEILKQVGDIPIKDALKSKTNGGVKSFTMKYTTDKNLFNRVNDSLKAQGYDAITDPNDYSTDFPVIFLDATHQLKLESTQTGYQAIDEVISKYK